MIIPLPDWISNHKVSIGLTVFIAGALVVVLLRDDYHADRVDNLIEKLEAEEKARRKLQAEYDAFVIEYHKLH